MIFANSNSSQEPSESNISQLTQNLMLLNGYGQAEARKRKTFARVRFRFRFYAQLKSFLLRKDIKKSPFFPADSDAGLIRSQEFAQVKKSQDDFRLETFYYHFVLPTAQRSNQFLEDLKK